MLEDAGGESLGLTRAATGSVLEDALEELVKGPKARARVLFKTAA